MASKRRPVEPIAKILTLKLSPALHRRFLIEARTYDGDKDGDKEKFLFALMEKYLSLKTKKPSKR